MNLILNFDFFYFFYFMYNPFLLSLLNNQLYVFFYLDIFLDLKPFSTFYFKKNKKIKNTDINIKIIFKFSNDITNYITFLLYFIYFINNKDKI